MKPKQHRIFSYIEAWLQRTGMLPIVQRLTRAWQLATNANLRGRDQAERLEATEFRRRYGQALSSRVNTGALSKRVLLWQAGRAEWGTQMVLAKGLEMAGYEPMGIAFGGIQDTVSDYYRLAGVRPVAPAWLDREPYSFRAAEAALSRCRTIFDLLEIRHADVQVGRFAAASWLKATRLGSIDIRSREIWWSLVWHLAYSMRAATAGAKLLDRTRPDLALFIDLVYTPGGEMFEQCLVRNIPAISWSIGHRSNAVMLKRYTQENRHENPWSLSPASWEAVRTMPWTGAHRERLQQELHESYTSRDWYAQCGTQFHGQMLERDRVRGMLKLDPSKPTAVIFPHILWDSSFFFGSDLFDSYEEWFIESVRAACKNTALNWIVKIHPANIGKAANAGLKGEPAEVVALRRHVGTLPAHIGFLPPESPISTYSLFSVMDACVTVRGTIGFEAARLGIPVLNGGTGRYSGKGFTMDPATREDYLRGLAVLHDVPRLTPHAQEMAERFCYGTFLLRPWRLTSVALDFLPSAKGDGSTERKFRLNVETPDDWQKAEDLRTFADWVTRSRAADYLLRTDG